MSRDVPSTKYEDEFDATTAKCLRRYEAGIYRNRPEGTAQTWLSAAVMYSRWLRDRRSVGVTEADKVTVDDYYEYVADEFVGTTAGPKIDGVQDFYSYLDRKELAEEVTADLDRATYRIDDTTRRQIESRDEDDYVALDKDEVELLWQEGNCPAPYLRNSLIIKLLWYTGIRCSELCHIRLQDLTQKEGEIRIYGEKTNDYHTVWYPQQRLNLQLADWLEYGGRDALSPYAEESPHLFLTHQREKMRPSHVSRIVKNAAQNAGLNEVMYEDANGRKRWRVSGHTLRSSMATYHANALSTPIHILSDMLNHDKLETTQKYVFEDSEARKRAMQDPWQ